MEQRLCLEMGLRGFGLNDLLGRSRGCLPRDNEEQTGEQQQVNGEEDEHGVGFTLPGIPITFSAITMDGVLNDSYSIQVDSADPPGEYVYTDELSLKEFVELIGRYHASESEWP